MHAVIHERRKALFRPAVPMKQPRYVQTRNIMYSEGSTFRSGNAIRKSELVQDAGPLAGMIEDGL